MRTWPHRFSTGDLVGGHVVLDLVNTITGRDGDAVDWLESYSGALEWAGLTAQFDERVLAELEQINTGDPDAGTLALGRLRELREAIHDVLAVTIRDGAASERTLRRLEARWKEAVTHALLTISDHQTRVQVSVESSKLDYLHHELALRAVDLLRTLSPARTRVCANAECGWLFIDRSKGGQRRWCDMATCGNAEKSRRHQERRRTAMQRNAR